MTMISNTKFVSTVIFIFLFVLNSFEAAKDLPSAIRHLKCHKNNVAKCFKENGNKAIPLIAKGDPEYEIPNMIPFKIPFISLISTPTLQLNLTNIEVYGLDKLKIMSQDFNEDKLICTVTLKGQNITVVGDYETDGMISVMPLRGKGRFNFCFKNGIYKSTSFLKVIEKEGDKYMIPIDSRLGTKFEKIEFKLDNLFDGDKKLGDQVNKFLNDNWEPLAADFSPTIEDTVSKIIKKIFGNISTRVPVKNVFYTD